MDGIAPYATPLLIGSTLYGVTTQGGVNRKGILFKINMNGTEYTVLYDFAGGTEDGSTPTGRLVHDGSTIYGVPNAGGPILIGYVSKTFSLTGFRRKDITKSGVQTKILVLSTKIPSRGMILENGLLCLY